MTGGHAFYQPPLIALIKPSAVQQLYFDRIINTYIAWVLSRDKLRPLLTDLLYTQNLSIEETLDITGRRRASEY